MRQALSAPPDHRFRDRLLCFLEGVIRGMIAFAEPRYRYPFNIGNPNELTLLGLAEAAFSRWVYGRSSTNSR